jgi:hypothetical protein
MKLQDNRPFLSIVAVSRNDAHGGNQLDRMQLFINSLMSHGKRYQLKAELVMVEWNPPPDKPRLFEALEWPEERGAIQVRVIEVPPKIHARFQYADQLPLYQMIAKNVGIRRSRGDFILATNIDILFSDALAQFLATECLNRHKMYRIDRYDISIELPLKQPLQMRDCDNNIIRIHTKEGTRNQLTGHYHQVFPSLTALKWFREKLQDWRLISVRSRSRLHTNACGDFILMAKDHWFKLKAYPEFEMYSFHLDSLFCYMAYHEGIKEQILRDPNRIYHIEHGAGSGWTPEDKDKLDDRLAASGIPQLGNQQLQEYAEEMRRKRQAIIFNDSNWGLGEEVLFETVV